MNEKQEISVAGVQLVRLKRISAHNGSLIVGEMPFVARRVFTILEVPPGEARGTHAHRRCEQFLICMSGSVTAVVDDGSSRREIVLDDPSLGLYMPALTWGTQYDYSSDAILVVLASDPYDADDYIHDYEEFLRLTASRRATM